MRVSSEKHIRGSRIVIVVCILFLAIICVIVSWAASYTIYNTDDFSTAKEYLDYESTLSNPFLKAVQMASTSWLRWGGHYFSSLLYYLLNPLIGTGVRQLSAIMTFNAILLIVSILFFAYTVFSLKGQKLSSCILAATCILWTFFDYKSWTEVLFWFAGAVDYSIELSMLLVGVSFFLKGMDSKKTVYFIVSLIVIFFASGGNQTIAMACFVMFVLRLIDERFIKKQKDLRIVYVIIAIFIPLLNLLAPGNFARHSLYGETHVLRSFFYALRIFVVETERLLKDSVFFVLLLLVFLWIFIQKDTRERVRLYEVISFWGISIGVAFLACLGYNSQYLPNRTLFVLDLFLIVGYVTLAILVGEKFNQRMIKSEDQRFFTVIASMMTLIVLVLIPYRIEDGCVYKLGKALVKGEIQAYYDEASDIYKQIEQSSQEDVIIDGLPEPVDGFVDIWLGVDDSDERYLGNQEAGAYYGKNIIVREAPKT